MHVMRLNIKFNENNLLFYVISMHLQKSLLVMYSRRMEKGTRSMTRQINETPSQVLSVSQIAFDSS